MKVLLKFIVLILAFFFLLAISDVLIYWIFSIVGIDFNQYGWIGVFVAFILMYLIYRNKKLSKLFNSKMLWISIAAILLLTLLIPNESPAYHHTNIFAYSYGFPFKFITLYLEEGTRFLIPNLFSSGLKEVSLNGLFLFNFLFYYLILYIFYHFVWNQKDNDLIKENRG